MGYMGNVVAGKNLLPRIQPTFLCGRDSYVLMVTVGGRRRLHYHPQSSYRAAPFGKAMFSQLSNGPVARACVCSEDV